MDERYVPYFRSRIEQIRSAVQPDTYVTSVFNAVQQESKDLRPDAELLLNMAFIELVAEPIRAVRGQDVDSNNLLEAIQYDVGRITRRAAQDGIGPLSAHDIIDATSRSWSELRTSQWELWD